MRFAWLNAATVLAVLFFTLSTLISINVRAEEEGLEALESTVVYPASYFAQYEPVSARDMLNRIPGVDINNNNNNNDNRRGLGAGDNQILINGKRIAGKENDGRDALSRIAAKQVHSIEIIRGTSGNLNVRSTGPIVNVKLKEGAARNSLSVEVNADYHQNDGHVQPGTTISFGGQAGDLNYLASIQADPKYQIRKRKEESVTGSGAANDSRRETIIRDEMDYKASGNLGYQINSRNLVQINGLYEITDPDQTIDRATNDFIVIPPEPGPFVVEKDNRAADRNKWEFGSNVTHTFPSNNKINAILVINDETDDSIDQRYNFTTDKKTLFVDNDNRTRERILRASYNRKLTDTQDIELGAEAAQTTLDSSYRLGLDLTGTHWASFGNLVPYLHSENTVEEIRYEPFAIHNWKINSNMSLESTLVVEFSKITQDGFSTSFSGGTVTAVTPVEQSRDFEYYRPKIDFRYDIANNIQLRAGIEREISQLSFRDFVARNNGDLDKNIDAGNPDLVPEKTWHYEVNFEYRLANDAGVLSSRVFYNDKQDVIDRVDVSDPADCDPAAALPFCTSAPGNIGDGVIYGIELNASVRLGFIDLPDALVTGRVFTADSKVKDPFTGEERRLSGRGRGFIDLGLRHDIPEWNFNYGFNAGYPINGGNVNVDVEDVTSFVRDPNVNLFFEKVAFGGITFHLDIMNALDGTRYRKRVRYVGPTSAGIVEEIEKSGINPGRKIALKVRTTF